MKVTGNCQMCDEKATHEYDGRFVCDLHWKRHGTSIVLLRGPRKK